MDRIENARDFLVASRNVIADPEHWTQGMWACDSDGESVDSCSPDAVRWCAVGAMEKVDSHHEFFDFRIWRKAQKELVETMRRLDREEGNECESGSSIQDYNDTYSHAEVLRAFDLAIEASGA